MKNGFEKEIRTINHALIIDIHALFECVDFSKTLVDNSLNTLQKSWKLETPSVNHAIMINLFAAKLTKLLTKSTSHVPSTAEDSMISNIVSREDWNNPIYVFRESLEQETLMTKKEIEASIDEDNGLT